jgi:two-component system phosphate regulon response regulator PhoB
MGDAGAQTFQDTSQRRVLIVDRDTDGVQALKFKLSQAGFHVATVAESTHAAAAIQANAPHLVLLDWDLPGAIAIDLVRRIRSVNGARPPRLIIFSMLAGDEQIVTGLELGADDYVVKPYSATEVVARARAVLRGTKREHEAGSSLRVGILELDIDEKRAYVRGQLVPLRTMEYRVLEFLMRHPERAFSRRQLIAHVWGKDRHAQERVVDVCVQRVRKALGAFGCEQYLQTIRSLGYRMTAATDASAPSALEGSRA